MRIMTAITVVWLSALGVFWMYMHSVGQMPPGLDKEIARLYPGGFIQLCDGIFLMGIFAVPLGWVGAIVLAVTRRRDKPPVRPVAMPTEPGLYAFDEKARVYRKVPPPC